MRPFNAKLWGCIGSLMVFVVVIFGCGSGNDLLDEVGQRYTATIEIEDYSGIELSMDVAQDDCDAATATNDDWEDYGPAKVNVIIAASSDAPGITLQSYTIQYIPQWSPNGQNQLVMPPDLLDGLPGNYSIDVAPGASATFSLTCISVDTKEEYRSKAGFVWVENATARYWQVPSLSEGRYTVRLTFTFLNTEGQTEIITKDATVWFGDFDNC